MVDGGGLHYVDVGTYFSEFKWIVIFVSIRSRTAMEYRRCCALMLLLVALFVSGSSAYFGSELKDSEPCFCQVISAMVSLNLSMYLRFVDVFGFSLVSVEIVSILRYNNINFLLFSSFISKLSHLTLIHGPY